MFSISVEQILVSSGYIGVFGLMIANGFFSVPSSQILYIIAGYFISRGDLNLFAVSFLGALGNSIGNIILYEAARRKGLAYITKYRMFPEREVKKVEAVFRRKGAWFVFIGKLLPAIKVFIPIPAGLGKMHRGLYAMIIFASSYLWSLIFISIGYYFGKSADFLGKYTIVLMVIAFIIVAIFWRMMNSPEIEREIEK